MMTKLCHSLWDYIVQRVELQWYAAVAVAICLCRLCSFPGNILSVITIAQLFRADKANRETINSANESFETVAGNKTAKEKAMPSTPTTITQPSSFNNSIKSEYNLLISFPYLPVVLWEGNGWESSVLRWLLLPISQLDHINLRNNFINAFIQFR